MKKFIGKCMMRLMGWSWKIEVDNSQVQKCVMVCAPHTSNWDFYYAVFGFWAIGLPIKVFIKESHINTWYGFIVKAIGGIPVNRGQSAQLVDYASEVLNQADKMVLIITPEGTRSYSPKWKKGFYYIAQRAYVPIVLGIGNYKMKQAQVVRVIDPQTTSLEETLDICQDTYKPEQAKYPEKYNPNIY